MKTNDSTSERRSSGTNRDRKLHIRIATAEDQAWCKETLAQHHYLGEADRIGDFMTQIAYWNGEAVALLVWGPASYALRDRDDYIGHGYRVVRGDVLQGFRLGSTGENPRIFVSPGGFLRAS